MALRDDILNAAKSPYYTIWSKISDAFIQNAEAQTNVTCQRIQFRELVNHYRIPLGRGGNEPVTFWGSAGSYEQSEAVELVEWYDAQTAGNIEAWLLLPDGRLVWTKAGGVVFGTDQTQYRSYLTDFLPTLTPSDLAPVSGITRKLTRMAYVLTPIADAQEVRKRYKRVAKTDVEPMRFELSRDGRPPATHVAGFLLLEEGQEEDVKREFPVTPGLELEVMILCEKQRLLWCNESGTAENGLVTFKQFLRDENLRAIPQPTIRRRS